MANEIYGCFGNGMMSGSYGYGWALFSWVVGILTIIGIVLFIIWITKKIENENNENIRRKKKK
jgi:uncharacterized membrane protein